MTILFRRSEKRWYGDTLADALIASRTASYGGDDGSPSSLVAAGAAMDLIANTAAALPLHEFRSADRSGNGLSEQIPLDGWLADPGLDGRGLRDWTKSVVRSLACHGNAVGVWFFNSSGVKQGMIQTPLENVNPVRDNRQKLVGWEFNGVRKGVDEVWHLRLNPVAGNVLGLSPLARYATTVGLAGHAERFLAGFYKDGAHPSAVLSLPTGVNVNDQDAKTIKERFKAAIRGRDVAVLGGGTSYQPLQLSPVDSDLLTSMKWSASEVARIWGPGVPEILGYETGGSMTYSNVVDRRQDFLTFALDPYLLVLEDALSAAIASPRRVQFNRDALLRSNTRGRYEAHAIGINTGFITTNEARALEDLPPVEWGDTPPPAFRAATPNSNGVPQ